MGGGRRESGRGGGVLIRLLVLSHLTINHASLPRRRGGGRSAYPVGARVGNLSVDLRTTFEMEQGGGGRPHVLLSLRV